MPVIIVGGGTGRFAKINGSSPNTGPLLGATGEGSWKEEGGKVTFWRSDPEHFGQIDVQTCGRIGQEIISNVYFLLIGQEDRDKF